MAKYEELLAHFKQTMPQAILQLEGTPAFGDAFNKWAGDIMTELGVGDWEQIPVEVLNEFEYVGPGSSAAAGGPAEQQIFNRIAPGLTDLISGDEARAAEAKKLAEQTRTAYGDLGGVLDMSTIKTGPDGKPTSGLLDAQRGNADATVQAIIDASKGNAAASNVALSGMTAEQIANLDKSIAAQKAALEQQVRELQGSAGQAADARRAALTQQLAELTAAQKPVSEARLRAAESEITGINLGLESSRDQLAADAAREGFYGPSSFDAAAQTRATIGARQDAARVGGAARVANATDDRGIGTYGANQGYSIADVFAGEQQRARDFGSGGNAALTAAGAEGTRGINDAGATGRFNIATTASREAQAAQQAGAGQKSAYFDQLYPNAVNAAQLKTQIPSATAGALTALIPYQTAGTRNALDVFNWFGTNATPPGSTAITMTPSNSGNQLGQFGANLVGGAFQLGNANWWAPKSTAKKPVSVVPSSPDDSWLD